MDSKILQYLYNQPFCRQRGTLFEYSERERERARVHVNVHALKGIWQSSARGSLWHQKVAPAAAASTASAVPQPSA